MSVLTDVDRQIVQAAIKRALRPRPRLTRTQALAPRPRSPKGEQPEPLLFVGLCSWCGAPAQRGSIACEGHQDLPALDSRTSAVVTHSTGGARTILGGSSASTPARRVTP